MGWEIKNDMSGQFEHDLRVCNVMPSKICTIVCGLKQFEFFFTNGEI